MIDWIKTAQGGAAIIARGVREPGRLVEPRPAAPRVLARAGADSPPDRDHLEQHEQPGAFAVAGAEEQEGGEPPPLAGAGVVVCLMG